MSILDLFRPKKWRHSDPAVRLQAIEQLSVSNDITALRRVLEKDPVDEVRLAAARRLGQDKEVLRRLVAEYKRRLERLDAAHRLNSYLDEPACNALTALARCNPQITPDVAKFLARNFLIKGPGTMTLASTATGQETSGSYWVVRPLFFQAIANMGACMIGGRAELDTVLTIMEEIHSQMGGWNLYVVNVSDSGQWLLSTAWVWVPGSAQTVSLDLEPMKNTLVEIVEGF